MRTAFFFRIQASSSPQSFRLAHAGSCQFQRCLIRLRECERQMADLLICRPSLLSAAKIDVHLRDGIAPQHFRIPTPLSAAAAMSRTVSGSTDLSLHRSVPSMSRAIMRHQTFLSVCVYVYIVCGVHICLNSFKEKPLLNYASGKLFCMSSFFIIHKNCVVTEMPFT